LFLKNKRIKNRKLINEIKKRPCVVCGAPADDAHHFKTQGSGGDDTEMNLLPVCRIHHTEVHSIGVTRMSNKYPHLEMILKKRGLI